MNINPSTLIDGYKVGHIYQYPENTEVILSNLTARSTRRPNTDKVVFAGLQYFLKEYLVKQWNENFFSKPIEEVVGKFNRRINNYIVPNDVGDQHIRDFAHHYSVAARRYRASHQSAKSSDLGY